MKRKTVALIIVFIFLTASPIMAAKPVSAATPVENSWTTKAPMHVARSGLGVAAVNGKIYAIGGSTDSGFAPSIPPSVAYSDSRIRGFVGTNEEYNPATDTWTYKTPMPTPRMSFAIAVVRNKIYCIGGRTDAVGNTEGYTTTNEVYNPETDTWETKAPLPVSASWIVASVLESKIYVVDYAGTNYVYDTATDIWTTKAPVPALAYDGYASAVVDNRIFTVNSKQLFIYNSETDMWDAGAPPPSSHARGVAGATIGIMSAKRVYVFGEKANIEQGENPGFVRVYNPLEDQWAYGADSPTNRYCFGVAAVNDTFYVIGGHTYTFPGNFAPTSINEQYTPIGYGTPDPYYVPPDITPPEVAVASPGNKTYEVSEVSLNFTVNESVSQMKYSLDGQDNVTVVGNATLTDLSYGNHNLTVYATDEVGNTGVSDTIYFTVEAPEPFPTTLAAAVSLATVVVVGVSLLVFYRRRRRREALQQ